MPNLSVSLFNLLSEKQLQPPKLSGLKLIILIIWDTCLARLDCSVCMWGRALLRLIICCCLASLFLSRSFSLLHTNCRWVTIIAPSLRHIQNKNCSTNAHTQTHTSTVLQYAHRYRICRQKGETKPVHSVHEITENDETWASACNVQNIKINELYWDRSKGSWFSTDFPSFFTFNRRFLPPSTIEVND